jgi:hypothetical protein
VLHRDRIPLRSVSPCHSSGGCGIRTRASVNPTRFPNPQTEVQTDPHVFVDACEAISRTLPAANKREQLRPKLRPAVDRARNHASDDRPRASTRRLSVAISRHVALCPRGRILSQKLVRKAKTLEDRGHHESGDLFSRSSRSSGTPSTESGDTALGHRPCPSDNDDRPARSQVAALLTELIGDELSAGRLPGDTPGDELAVFAIPTLEAAGRCHVTRCSEAGRQPRARGPSRRPTPASSADENTDLNRSAPEHDRSQGAAHGHQSPWTVNSQEGRNDHRHRENGTAPVTIWPSGFSPSAR